MSSVITGTTITAKFTDDSKITGSAGCNHYGGEYLLDGANPLGLLTLQHPDVLRRAGRCHGTGSTVPGPL
ncbi:MAG: META domain-containing protein [Acholeplasmataceae bacterium]